MILEKMRFCFWKLELGFWSYGLISLLGPIGPNIVSRSQNPRSRIFWDNIILLHSSRDSWESEVLFEKIGARVLEQWLDKSFPKGFGPKLLKLVFRPDPKCQTFGIWKFFHAKLHKILHQISSFFPILGHFWQSSECLFPVYSSTIFFWVSFQIGKFKKDCFWSTKI